MDLQQEKECIHRKMESKKLSNTSYKKHLKEQDAAGEKMIEKIKSEKEIPEIKKKCMYCNKVIAVFCGTPLIYIGGCGYGAEIEGKKKFIFSRKAHIECWLKHNKYYITKLKNEAGE